jgi:hypothetical protein
LDGVANDLKKMGFRKWRKTVRDKDACPFILQEATVLCGL